MIMHKFYPNSFYFYIEKFGRMQDVNCYAYCHYDLNDKVLKTASMHLNLFSDKVKIVETINHLESLSYFEWRIMNIDEYTEFYEMQKSNPLILFFKTKKEFIEFIKSS